MKTVSLDQVMAWEPCDAYPRERIEELAAGRNEITAPEIVALEIPANVWAGECPHCGAINLLALTSLRGYSSAGMNLVLPTAEEVAANDLPADTPNSGACGKPADMHGTVAGELYNQLLKEEAAQ